MRVHRPVAPKSLALAMAMKPARAAVLGIGRNRVLEIAEHHVDLRDQLRHLGAYLLDVRRHEMDHALELDRKLAQRRRRADRERLEEVARELHCRPNFPLPSMTPGFRLRYGERLSLRQAAFAFTGGKIDQFKGSR